MTSPKNLHETIATMRQRVREIDRLIAGIEQGRIPAQAAMIQNRNAFRPIRVCKPIPRRGEEL